MIYIIWYNVQGKRPSNKTPALMKSMKMDIWVVSTTNQLFRRGSHTEKIFFKKQSC